MSTLATSASPVVQTGLALRTLARIEAKRFGRHPLFLIGLALATIFSAGEHGPIELDYHVIPSFFIGVLGLVVAARLTTSTSQTQPIVGSAPVSQTTRTAALCLACLVPAAAGLVVVLMHQAFVLADPFPGWMYGTYGSFDRFLIVIVVPVIACAGGPLLGVAVGRWLHFPGATLLSVVAVLFWCNVSGYLPTQTWESDTFGSRLLHMASPYTAFASGDGDGETATTTITSYTGSPLWYAVWTLCLCALAVTAALWPGANQRTRQRLTRVFVGLGAAALVSLALSVVTGNQHLYQTTSDSTVVVAQATPSPTGP